jgi:hypothetical protein
MVQQPRPTLRLHLSGKNVRDGEMPLADLAKVADQTQRVVTRIARGLIDYRSPGPVPGDVADATTLFLFGLGRGSIVLDIALSAPAQDTLNAQGMPIQLGEIAITALAESLELLSGDEPTPDLPVGIDDKAVEDIDDWLRTLRDYQHVTIDAELSHSSFQAEIVPRDARIKLKNATSQPAMPYISADHQAITGRLYALNLRTGTFRIEDDARHSIRLTVPEDMRSEAAQLIDAKVRAIGKVSLDEHHRFLSFTVAALEELPDLIDQLAFFQRHDLVEPTHVITSSELSQGVIPDLSDDEIDDFIAALEAE